MRWQVRLGAIVVWFILAGALASGQDKKESTSTNYYPLQVGNQWDFHVEAGNSIAKAVSRIVKTETINGVSLAYLEFSLKGTAVANEHLRQTEKGVFRYRNNGQEIIPPICLLQYPAKAGAKWGGDISVGADKGKYSSEASEETIEVNARKFKAMRVSIKLESPREGIVHTTYWFVPDVGLVRQTVDTGKLNIVMELEKFEPAKKKK